MEASATALETATWKRDDTYAAASENMGSRIMNMETGDMEYKDVGADAQVDLKRGVVICHADYPFIGEGDADGLAVSIFGTESFHNGDYPLFFNNIKQNVKTRIDSYFEKLESNQ